MLKSMKEGLTSDGVVSVRLEGLINYKHSVYRSGLETLESKAVVYEHSYYEFLCIVHNADYCNYLWPYIVYRLISIFRSR
jgi:hypothetical protein